MRKIELAGFSIPVVPVLILILVLSLGMRLAYLDRAGFNTNEARDYERALLQVKTGQLEVYGMEVFGLPARMPGPAYYYLLSIPALFSPAPWAMSLFFALCNTLAVWLLYLLVRAIWDDQRIALLAAFLYGVFPWPLRFSVQIWNPYLVAPFVILFFWLVYSWFSREHTRLGFWVFPVYGIAAQLHITCLPLVVAPLFLMFFRRDKARDIWFWLGTALTLAAVFVPFLVAEAGGGFANLRALSDGRSFQAHPEVLRIFSFAIVGGSLEMSEFISHNFGKILRRLGFPSPWAFLYFAAALASLVAMLAAYWNGWRQVREAAAQGKGLRPLVEQGTGWALMLLWLLLPLGFILLTMKPVESRYLAPMLPLLFVLLAHWWVAWLERARSLLRSRLFMAYLVAPLILFVFTLFPPLGKTSHEYPSLRQMAAVLQRKGVKEVHVHHDSRQLIAPLLHVYGIKALPRAERGRYSIQAWNNYQRRKAPETALSRHGTFVLYRSPG